MGPRPRKSDGVDGARSGHVALARCEYDLLALVATKGGPANVGAASSEDGHEATVRICVLVIYNTNMNMNTTYTGMCLSGSTHEKDRVKEV